MDDIKRSAHTACSVTAMIMTILFISACGGGGGGGGVSSSSSSPPAVRVFDRPVLPQGASYSSEFSRQSALGTLSLSSIYQDNHAGFQVKTAVVDTGIDGSHSELETVKAGLDWHGSSDGLSDPQGHGTHVASLLGGARDGRGMHGIAPLADITSYRIFDRNGSFGSKTGGQILPALVADAGAKNIHFINNSWASNFEITDLSKSVVNRSLGAELGAWQAAVADGMVLVWAAGNDGDDEVSIRAGLPYYHRHLQKGWLAVVAVDSTGREPRYTNRCGVARQWCLTAPGGGDSVYLTGLYGARSGGGYERRSGTSMAAPLVTGALALIKDAFPQLSAQQAANRLLQTANYAGLTAANGCTLSKCGADRMASIFGHGMMDVSAALSPIGTLSISANDADVAVDDAALEPGLIIDEAMLSAMTGVRFIASDSFDNAQFAIQADSFLGSNQQLENHNDPAPLLSSVSRGNSWHYIADTGLFPEQILGRAQLTDISYQPMQHWFGIASATATADAPSQWQLHFGYDTSRQLVLMHRHFGSISDHSGRQSWLSFGLDRSQNRWLDSRGTGALRWGDGQAYWLSSGYRHAFGVMALQAEMLAGQSKVTSQSGCLICAADATFSSWQIGLDTPIANSDISFTIKQPLQIDDLSLTFSGASIAAATIKPARPARQLEAKWQNQLPIGALTASYQLDDIQAKKIQKLSLGWRLSF